MRDVVKVVTDAEYKTWVDGKKKEMAALADDPTKTWTIDELKTKGEKIYTANCVVCHQANGKGVPNAFAPLDGSASSAHAPRRVTPRVRLPADLSPASAGSLILGCDLTARRSRRRSRRGRSDRATW